LRHGQFAGNLAQGGKPRAGIQAVVQGDVAGQGVKQDLLGLEGDDIPPTRRVPRPLNGVHADVGAAVDGDHAVAEMPAAAVEQGQGEAHLFFVETRSVEDLEPDAVAAGGIGHLVIIAIDDHDAMVARGQDEGDRTWWKGHG
jgi:hypothetical protein